MIRTALLGTMAVALLLSVPATPADASPPLDARP